MNFFKSQYQKMAWRDKCNAWSWVHLFGSFTLVTILTGFRIPILLSCMIVFVLGIIWEYLIDGYLIFGDKRGGDFFDLIFDLVGCLSALFILCRFYNIS